MVKTQPQTTAFQTALASRNQIVEETATVQDPSGNFLAELTPVGGTWQVDETAAIRRSISGMTLKDPTGSLSPSAANTLLNPNTGNELVYSWGLVLPDGTVAQNQIGVFRLSKPRVALDPEGLTITLSANDRSYRVSQYRWVDPFPLPMGASVAQAVKLVLEDRFGGLDFSQIQDVGGSVPPGTALGVQAQGDPWADLETLVKGVGAELFFDPLGRPVLREIVDPDSALVVATYTAGQGGVGIAKADRDLDETQTFSGVVVTSASDGNTPPARAVVWDSDPNSHTYALGINNFGENFGKRPAFYVSPVVLTVPQCFQTANRLLRRVRRAAEVVNVTLLSVNPGLEAGDCLYLKRDYGSLTGRYIASNFTGPIGGLGQMSITTRSTGYITPGLS